MGIFPILIGYAGELDTGATTAPQLVPEERGVRLQMDYFRSACAFAELLDASAVGALEPLLRSRTASDALEAQKFFLRSRAFALPCGARGVLAALALVLAAE